ncbi:MAG: hypothetical protein COT84_01970 [Chlamydiae bacterium CG10_big_fil_rev_8_21_14_0_10_35_9]|nr:MAG: hypothetical protein COT84_01970 [Chlamydiae bacterium CG10_big_fil_rev_8_21_14_0_10_35_9]
MTQSKKSINQIENLPIFLHGRVKKLLDFADKIIGYEELIDNGKIKSLRLHYTKDKKEFSTIFRDQMLS